VENLTSFADIAISWVLGRGFDVVQAAFLAATAPSITPMMSASFMIRRFLVVGKGRRGGTPSPPFSNGSISSTDNCPWHSLQESANRYVTPQKGRPRRAQERNDGADQGQRAC
jgi:hypothetical protein